MKLFSQRLGFKPVRCELQIKDMDADLRCKLWNVFQIQFWDHIYGDDLTSSANIEISTYLKALWNDHFKRPLDTLPYFWHKTYAELRKYFFNCVWNEVYDFVEFAAQEYPISSAKTRFITGCNEVLEEELSGFQRSTVDSLRLPVL